MENREQQILAEIKSLMSSVRMQLERLDAKMAELQQVYEPQEYSLEPFDVSMDDVAMIAGDRESVLESTSEIQETVLEIPEPVVPQPAVIDVMTARQAWKTDIPGSPVKDVRAAIALVDRALFINKLFGGDAASFMEAVNAVNQMTSLQQVEEYMVAHHPEWNFDSDVVYRFMMAVRRKVN